MAAETVDVNQIKALGTALGLSASAASAFALTLILGPFIARALVWFSERRQAKRAALDWLVQALEKPSVCGSRYLVEQAYAGYMGKILDYYDLEALLKRPNPSRSTVRYGARQKHVAIRRSDSKFEYRIGYRKKWWRITRRIAWLVSYCLFAGIAGLIAMSLNEQHRLFSITPAHLLLAFFFFLGIFGLDNYTNYVSAAELAERSANYFWPNFVIKRWRSAQIRRFGKKKQ